MVSIVIPTYNRPDLVIRAINSALKQDVEKEIIVVNDCSDTDYSAIKDLPIDLYIEFPENLGLSKARNKGISQAKYKWILPLDDDDELCEGVLKEMVKLGEESDADVVYGNVIYHGNRLIPNKDIKPDDFKKNNQLYVSSLFKKDLWEQIGGYWEVRDVYEDWDFWGRISRAGFKFKYIPIDVYKYHGGEAVSGLEKQREDISKKVVEHIFK